LRGLWVGERVEEVEDAVQAPASPVIVRPPDLANSVTVAWLR
jgi:hypothetical protein